MEVVNENSVEEDDVWAQTIFTITPQENGTLREISEETKISGTQDADLELNANNIIKVQKIESPGKHFIDPGELSRMPFAEVECQTYIQDIDKVHIPIELINEASQTFYIGTQQPVQNVVQDVIAAISKKSIPIFKTGKKCQTIITFNGNYHQDELIDKLFTNHDKKSLESFEHFTDNIAQIEIWHCLNHIIERVFWNSDPEEPIKDVNEAETLTDIVCNLKTGKAIFNQETQTSLTCEPRVSNSKLLDDYLEIKMFVKQFLEDCLLNGAYKRMLIDDILGEILDSCSKEIRFPSLDNEAQTLASYKTVEGGDDDILKKLRRPVAVDPEESHKVVNLLTEEIIETIFIQISKKAEVIVKYILCVLIKKSILTAIQLQEKRKSKEFKPLDKVFIERKKKLAKRRQPKTETIATQTKLAGVPEVKKLPDIMESSVLCSVCTTQSECNFCCNSQANVKFGKQVEILKTQDILLTYKPCYIRTTSKYVKLHNFQVPQKIEKIQKSDCQISSSEMSFNSFSGSSKTEVPVRRIYRKSKFIS